MRVIKFSGYSDSYLDYDEDRKNYIITHIKNSSLPFVSIMLTFKVVRFKSDRRQHSVYQDSQHQSNGHSER